MLRKERRRGNNETEWWGYSATRRGYKAAAFDSGSSHATNFHHSQMNLRGTHAPQNETVWWGCSATRRGYKAAAFDSGSSHATNFHHSQMNLRGTHAPQNETEWWGYSATRRGYKAAAFDSGSSHATNFYHSYMNLHGTHAPQGKEKRIKRSGGDTVPLGGNIRRPPLAVGPFLPRISTVQFSNLANETEWWGYSATWERYKETLYKVVSIVSGGTLGRGPRVWAFRRVTVSKTFSFSFPLLSHFLPTWVGSTCDIVKSILGDRGTNHRGIFTRKEGTSPCFRTRMIEKTLTRVTAGTRVGVRGREIKSCRGLRFDFEIEI
ncbi:uncharacterized protein V1477_004114 [Vespula maculifrons]|uniref:Uncharacterized protein n=1 Tax=Vespula maculifrons TaxID=7453 RepID=A0ABD2CQP0_VESMC